jgi:hypothetical protein
MALRDVPADFWLGVGMVAEAPLAVISWLLPADACNAMFSQFVECPPSIWIIILIALISYISVAWAAYKLGFGGKN